MIVVVIIMLTVRAEGEILLSVVGNNTVDDPVITKAIQDTIDGCPVNVRRYALPNVIVAERSLCVLQSR